jgi:hypothetical protein
VKQDKGGTGAGTFVGDAKTINHHHVHGVPFTVDEIRRRGRRRLSKPAGQRGFAVIPRRWAVERTFALLTAHRRLARDYERDPAVSEAMIRWAAINTITRRIARDVPATRQHRRTFPTSS